MRRPPSLPGNTAAFSPKLDSGGENSAMGENLERLKQSIPLLEYLQRHNWKPCRTGPRQEFVGLCPLHQETRPSFYVNAAKNLFYCHGCGRGGDLIRFVQIFLNLSIPRNCGLSRTGTHARSRYPITGADGRFLSASTPPPSEAIRYLEQRGLHDPALHRRTRHRLRSRRKSPPSPGCLGLSFDLLLETG